MYLLFIKYYYLFFGFGLHIGIHVSNTSALVVGIIIWVQQIWSCQLIQFVALNVLICDKLISGTSMYVCCPHFVAKLAI